MSKLVNVLKVAGILAAVVGVGLLLGWFGTRGHHDNPPPPAPNPSTSPHVEGIASTAPKPAVQPPAKNGPGESASPTPPPAEGTVVSDWEAKLDQILTSSSVEEADKAKQMLELFPRLPEDGQVEVARHIANLLPDSEYSSLAKYLVDPKTPAGVLEVLLGDALNRPHSVKMPLLLEIAKQSDHPKAGEAKELLQLFLEEDYGSDWNQWQTKLEQWLKDNPD